jgi:hypothetical protein
MGRGGDAGPLKLKRTFSLESLSSVKDDLVVLRHLWFGSKKGDSHAARLESFYSKQASKVGAWSWGSTCAWWAVRHWFSCTHPIAQQHTRR